MRSARRAHTYPAPLRSLIAVALMASALLLPTRTATAAPAIALIQAAPAAVPAAQSVACSTVVTSTADSGAGSLRSAAACVSGGSTVTFAPATFSIARTITLTGQIPITRSLVISGPGSSLLTISGNNVTRTLYIDAGFTNDVRLFGVTLARGRAFGDGGAVFVKTAKSLTIASARIMNSTAVSTSVNPGIGGGLYAGPDVPLILVDAHVLSNTAGSSGGFHVISTVTMSATTIASNSALTNGGFYAGNGVSMAASTVASNTAVSSNGGFSTRRTVTMISSTVAANTTRSSTGGFYAGGAVTMISSTVAANTTRSSIGGFYAGGAVSMTASAVASNTAVASVGGFTAMGPLTMVRSTVVSNTSSDFGGFNAWDAVSMTASTVASNTVRGYYGGFYAGGPVSMTASSIAFNAAGNIGGFETHETVTMISSTVTANTAVIHTGGFTARRAVMTASTVASNTAGGSTGGIYVSGALTMISSTIAANTSGEGVGGISVNTLTMTSTQVLSNSTYGSYGGFITSGAVTIIDSTIASNTARISTGGFYVAGRAIISNSTIANNRSAGTFGGVNLAFGSTAHFIHVTIISNTAPSVAGINIGGSGPHYFTSTIIGGTAAEQCFVSAVIENFSSISTDAKCRLRTVPSVGVAPLGNYGGGQPTAPLVAASPALDAANPAACPRTDQRGLSRVGVCDIGAYESRGFSMTVQSGAVQTTSAGSAFTMPLVVRFTGRPGEPLGPGGLLYVASPGAGASLVPSVTIGQIDARGWATVPLTAGNTTGSFPISITAAGITTTATGRMTAIRNCSVVVNTADSGEGSLRSAVSCAPAGSTVTFDPATFSVARTITLTSQITIARSLSISGPGMNLLTISGNDKTRTLYIDAGAAGDIRLAGMTLARGRVAGNGGAVFVQSGSLTISDTQIVSNVATAVEGGTQGEGGGLYVSGMSQLTLVGSRVLSNTAHRSAGFYAGNAVTMTSSTVAANNANMTSGGFQAGGVVTMNASTVASNTARNTAFGGFQAGGVVTMINSQVLSNTTGGTHGGFYARTGVTMTDSIVASNTAGSVYGGFRADGMVTMIRSAVRANAVTLDTGTYGGFYSNGAVTMLSSTVASNIAGSYGGFSGNTLTMVDSRVSSNTAAADVGGFYTNGATALTRSVVSANNANNYAGFMSQGTVTMIDSQVLTNTARTDVGGFWARTASLSRSVVASNTAASTGGFDVVNKLTMIDSRVLSNFASAHNGGFKAKAVEMVNSQVLSNSAGAIGGGFTAGAVTMVDSQVMFNSAGTDGGGFKSGDTVIMTRSQVMSNSAGADGGGFTAFTGMTMVDSQVMSNSAGRNGGGIWDGGTAAIANSTIASNEAGDSAGGIYVIGTAAITGSTIASNIAGTGAGIVARWTLVVSNSTIAANTALTRAGGVSITVSSAGRFIHASIVSNSAPSAAGIYFVNAGPHFFTNTIVGGAAAGQCDGTATKQNFSSISNDPACGLRAVPSIGVGSLGEYGGSQPTAPLVAASPALDAANPAACPPADQRGLARVGACDVGAYESRGGFSFTVKSGGVQTTSVSNAFPVPLVAHFTSSKGEPLGPGGVLYVTGPDAGASLAPSLTFGLVDAQGWASVPMTAGKFGGYYPITITAAGIASPATGRMNNVAPATPTRTPTSTPTSTPTRTPTPTSTPLPVSDEISRPLIVDALPYDKVVDATTMSGSPSDPVMDCGSVNHRTVWIRYTPSASRQVKISTLGSTYDTVLAVFRGAPGSLRQIACNDDASDKTSLVYARLTAGTTYYIVVASYDATAGSLILKMEN